MMQNLISRQAAIDAVLHHGEIENNYTDLYHDGYCDGVYDSADTLKSLPSAQPDIIRCRDCKNWKPQVKVENRGLGTCSFHNAKYVTSEGYCYWAERRTDDERRSD